VTTIQGDRINNLRYRVPRNTFKTEALDSHEYPVHFYRIRNSHTVEGGNIYSRLRPRISLMIVYYKDCKGKGKAVPLQASSGPEGSRKLRIPDFMTTA